MIFIRIIGRILNRLLVGLGRVFIGLFRWVARHEMLLGVLTVLTLLTFGGWLLLNALNINIVFGQPQAVVPAAAASATPTPAATATPVPAPTAPPVTRTNAPAATEAFMTGQVNGNADQVWSSMTASLHNELAGQGRDKTFFQRQFEAQKRNGLIMESYQYVGGVPNENGTSIHFYVLTVITSDKKANRIPWTFVVDREGKIASTEFPY